MAFYEKLENESELELLWRIGLEKEKTGLTWDQIASEMNYLTGKSKSESSWRKKWAAMDKVVNPKEEKSEFKIENKVDNVADKMRELERKKIMYRDQRAAWNKQNYRDARVDETLEILENKFSEIRRTEFPEVSVGSSGNKEKELIICLSDLHVGQSFNNVFGKYDSEIAKIRLSKYLNKIHEVANLYHPSKVNIVSLGDQISGNIHHSIAVTNKENVIEQIKMATSLIASFCRECCRNFETVHFYSVSGNHTRIDKKEDSLHNERLDDIISWAVGLCLADQSNFFIMDHRHYDIGIADVMCCGNSYIAVHGDYDAMSKTGISNLSMMLGYVPFAVLRGHNHYPAMTDVSGVKVIQSGSLPGSGDDHTVEMRLKGNPSQTILVCDSRGIDAIYNVDLV